MADKQDASIYHERGGIGRSLAIIGAAVLAVDMVEIGLRVNSPENEWTVVIVLQRVRSQYSVLLLGFSDLLTSRLTCSDAYHHRPRMIRPPGKTTPS